MKMKALRFENNKLNVDSVDVLSGGGEALIRVVKSGVCNTDLEIVRGYAGFSGTLGHEFVGVVEECGDAPELVGKRVVGEINCGCGGCEKCLSGDERHCPQRTVLGIIGRDGCHAEFVRLPSRNLFEVPAEVSDAEAVFTEPLAAAHGILEQISVTNETKAAVIGDGKLGILCAQALHAAGAKVSLIGKHKEKMRVAENRGVEGVLLANAPKLKQYFDVVVEASGAESGFETALDSVRPRGKIVLKSTFSGKPTWEAWRVVVEEISIVGSRCGRFAPALELLRDKKVDVLSLISEEMNLRDGVKALERAAEKGVLKVLLQM